MELTKEFGDILMDFFIDNDKKYKRKVKKLVAQFAGRENECIISLCQKYNVDPATIEGINLSQEEKEQYKPKPKITIPSSNDSEGLENSDNELSDDETHTSEESIEQSSGNKKKKKLMIIALTSILILVGGGYGAMLFLGSNGTEAQGTDINNEEVIEQGDEQNVITDSSMLDSTALNDSTAVNDSTAFNDSTAADSASMTEADTDSQATE